MSKYNGAGVYVFRTRRPGLMGYTPLVFVWGFAALYFIIGYFMGHPPWLLWLIPLLLNPRHTAYVGESRHVRSRRIQHIAGSVQYNEPPKPWTDLKPSWYFIALPWAPKWVLRSVETMLIALLWPVYNHQKNLWNPRRIPLRAAKRQRGSRDVVRWSFNFRWGHALLWVILIWVCIAKGWVG